MLLSSMSVSSTDLTTGLIFSFGILSMCLVLFLDFFGSFLILILVFKGGRVLLESFSSLISSALVVVEWLLQTAAANLSATFVAPTDGYYVVNGEVESLFLLHI